VVVHRPSTIALADRVAFLHRGRIAAVGLHHELMERVPPYRAVLSQEADPAERRSALLPSTSGEAWRPRTPRSSAAS
jgi:ATP-binding cassette subfamily B protein